MPPSPQQVQQAPVPLPQPPARETLDLPDKEPPSSPSAGDIWTEPVTGMEFVWVPSGCYMMGTPEGGSFDSASLTNTKETVIIY